MSVLCQPLNGPPGMIEGLQLCFHSPTPGDLRSSSLTFPLWCPAKGCAGDVALLPSHDMSDPFPSSSHNDGTHIVLVTASKKFLVGDGLRPEYTQDSSKVFGMEGGQLVEVALCHPPTF